MKLPPINERRGAMMPRQALAEARQEDLEKALSTPGLTNGIKVFNRCTGLRPGDFDLIGRLHAFFRRFKF